MKLSRVFAFALAASIGFASLGAPAPAQAGALGHLLGKAMGLPDYSVFGNKGYMSCLKFVGGLSGRTYPGLDANIRNCKRTHGVR
jgi:hypothetical protein